MSPLPQAPRRVLVVSLRFLGDALLSTPLAAAAKREWPGCAVDMLVFRGCEGILEGNPDIDHVLTVEHKPGKREQLRQLRELWNRYDLAFITQSGTRPFLYGWAAGRRAVAPVAPERNKSWWKQLLLWRHVRWDLSAPRFLENEQLLSVVGIDQTPAPKPPSAGLDPSALFGITGIELSTPYVVLHPSPRWRYKRWTDAGWRTLAQWLLNRNYSVVFTGGPGEEERAYLEGVIGELQHPNLHVLPGRLRLAQTADLLRTARAYVGVDTATTHLAAATGTPTLAIFGPTDPAVWGPWPALGGHPYAPVAALQRRGNVALVQNPVHTCQPCQKEGCERNVKSHSACLDDLSAEPVIAALQSLLEPATIAASASPATTHG